MSLNSLLNKFGRTAAVAAVLFNPEQALSQTRVGVGGGNRNGGGAVTVDRHPGNGQYGGGTVVSGGGNVRLPNGGYVGGGVDIYRGGNNGGVWNERPPLPRGGYPGGYPGPYGPPGAYGYPSGNIPYTYEGPLLETRIYEQMDRDRFEALQSWRRGAPTEWQAQMRDRALFLEQQQWRRWQDVQWREGQLQQRQWELDQQVLEREAQVRQKEIEMQRYWQQQGRQEFDRQQQVRQRQQNLDSGSPAPRINGNMFRSRGGR
jgi:hypothetical protein